jgi:hypothetical protein
LPPTFYEFLLARRFPNPTMIIDFACQKRACSFVFLFLRVDINYENYIFAKIIHNKKTNIARLDVGFRYFRFIVGSPRDSQC